MGAPLIGALRVSLSAETASFEAGMRRAQRTAAASSSGIKKSLGLIKAGIAAFGVGLSVGLLTNAIKESLDYVSHLKELSETLGLTTKDFQTFSYAAGQVGIAQEDLQTGIQKLTISMGKAQVGSQAQVKAFNAIGISVDQLKGKNAGDIFRLMAERLEKVSDRSKRAAVEVALFGKSGAKLDNLLSGAEGRLQDLTRAAEELGIVLSEDQIQKADKTADKIAALQTVLKARVAGVVADNAAAIYDLAGALAELVVVLAKAAAWLGRTGQALESFARDHQFAFQLLQLLIPGGPGLGVVASAVGGGTGNARQISVKLPPPTLPAPKGGGDVSNFLAGDKKAKADHSAEEALTRQHQFDVELQRANIDILNAKKDLASDYVEQTAIAIQIKDAEADAYAAERQYQVALYKLTKGKQGETQAQADQLMAAYASKDALERQAILDDEEAKRKEDFNQVTQDYFDRRKDVLQAELQIAETAQEQRDIQLRLLDLSYRQEKARLEAVLADEKASYAAKLDAQQRLDNLNKTRPLDTQAVIQNTRGPLDEYIASLPTTAAKANEALQRLEVQGFQGLIDAAGQLSEGFDSAAQALLQTLKNFIAGLLQMELQKGLGSFLSGGGGAGFLGALGSIFGGGGGGGLGFLSAAGDTSASLSLVDLPAFASGGSGIFKGIPGIDKNILSMNGLPIARVSHGERFSFGNDNSPAPMMPSFVFNNYARMSPDEARRTGAQAAAGWNAAMNKARVKGIS